MTTASFRKHFAALPEEVQDAARSAYRLWLADSRHRSLHFRRVHPSEPIYSVRIGLHWRAVALVEQEVATWYWIGSHSDYDKLIANV